MSNKQESTQKELEAKIAKMAEKGWKIVQLPLPDGHTRIRAEKQPSSAK